MNNFITSFNAYFKSVTYAPLVRIPMLASVLAMYFIIFDTIACGVGSQNGWGMCVACLCAMIFLSGLLMSNYYYRKPDLVSLMPISPARSLAYRFLSVFVMFVIITIAVVVVLLTIFVIALLFSLIPSCKGAIEEELPDSIENVTHTLGLYGGLFGFLYFIIMYAAGMISGFIQRRKYRNIYLICLCVAILLSQILMNIPLMLDSQSGLSIRIILMSSFDSACYEAMALPQLCIALWAVVAVAMTGMAIYLGIKENKIKSSY